MFKMKQSIQWCTSIKDLPEMKPFYAPKRHVPDFFQFWCTFSLFFFPLRIIPVKFIKHHHHSRGKVKMLMHPFCLQDAFRYVPFICGALEIGNKSWLLQKLQPPGVSISFCTSGYLRVTGGYICGRPKGPLTLGWSGGMLPRKILKF